MQLSLLGPKKKILEQIQIYNLNFSDKTQERQQKPLKMVPLNSLDSSRILVKLTKKNSTPLSTGALKVFEPNHSNLHLER